MKRFTSASPFSSFFPSLAAILAISLENGDILIGTDIQAQFQGSLGDGGKAKGLLEEYGEI
jgi:hypothetical protein